jgi:TolB-like protein/Flp pilus assembly protein TadD
MSVEATPTPKAGAAAQGRRLESWKEIAAYLGRDVTTVRRWEKGEGLPVHRHLHNKLGSVYAYTTELDSWRNNRAPAAATDAPDTQPPVPESVRLGRHGRMAAVLAAITLILAAGVLWLVRERTGKPAASVAIRSLAVLPLANFSGNAEQDYLSDGMTEALTAQLSAIHGLRVISRTSTMQLKGTRKSVPAIGKELNVDAVIEGSVLRSGDKVRVTVQLIRAATDEHLWASTYDRELRDILALQSDVAQGIARHVEAAVAGAQNLAVAPRTVAPEVYEAYLKGRFALTKGNRASLDEALGFFTAAIDADSTFAPAYVGVAAAQEQLGTVFFGVPPEDSRPKVIEAARKALELDPQLAEARVLLAHALQRDWHWEEAETEFRRAIELSPSDAGAHAGLAYWLVCQGRSDEALAWARRAQEIDPLTYNSIDVSGILFFSRRYDEAIRESRRNLTTNPNDPQTLWSLGFALIGAEQFDDAIRTLEKAASLSDRSPAVLGVLVRAYAYGGRRAEALQLVDELRRRERKGYVPAAAFLNAYLGLGDKEQAFVWLESAAQERSNIMQFLKVHPFFDLLRGDPRFAEYLRRANLRP